MGAFFRYIIIPNELKKFQKLLITIRLIISGLSNFTRIINVGTKQYLLCYNITKQ